MKRKHDTEIMDDFSIQDERIDNALDELKMINILLGGAATTRKGFRILRTQRSLPERLNVLDAGAGGADVFRVGSESFVITALDKNPRTCLYLTGHSDHSVVCGDAIEMPFKKKSFDVVHVSLFLHHFTEWEIVKLIQSFTGIARYGIIINDLRRSRLALIGISLLTALFSRSGMVKHDAPLSVRRGFTKNELVRILNECGCNNFIIKRTWAFRWLVVITV